MDSTSINNKAGRVIGAQRLEFGDEATVDTPKTVADGL
jgi:hypothetical protein